MKFQLDAISGVNAPEGGIETVMSEVSVSVSDSPSLKEILMSTCNLNSQYVLGHLFYFLLSICLIQACTLQLFSLRKQSCQY